MSLEAVLASIRQQAEEEAGNIEADAETRAERIRAEASEKAERIRQETRRSTEETARQEELRLEREADFEVRKVRQEAALEIVDRAAERARDRLDNVRDHPAYEEILHRLAQEALGALQESLQGGEQGTIVVNASDEPILARLKSDLGWDFDIHAEDDGMWGVIARSADQRVVVDNRLDSRLEQALPGIRDVFIAQALGREGS